MKNLKNLLILTLLSTLLSGAAFAGAAEIKARMKARLPQIVALKKAQSIGENNRGLLEAMPGKPLSSADSGVISAENADRQVVYEMIAKKTGTDAADVARRRAISIAEIALPGTKIQTTDGSWKTK